MTHVCVIFCHICVRHVLRMCVLHVWTSTAEEPGTADEDLQVRCDHLAAQASCGVCYTHVVHFQYMCFCMLRAAAAA
jgi:hypothetical protein